MKSVRKSRKAFDARGWLWFILLWLCGVAGTALLVLPFRVLVALAMRN